METEVRRVVLRTGVTLPVLLTGPRRDVPLLLLHPWGESRRTFDRLVPALPGFRLIVPDLRGHGEADKPDGGYSLSEQAADVVALLDALHVTRAFVLGSSSGGYVAQQLAVSFPERVAALVLLGTPLSLTRRPDFADELARLTDPVSESWVRASLAWFPLERRVPTWFIEDRVRDGVRIPARAWSGVLEGLCAAVPPTETGLIQAPTLILWGALDLILPRSSQEKLADRISDSRLKVYPGVGHLVLWEVPELVAEDAALFLASVH
ncbi:MULTISPECIES: alpha/beta fold hydrolase [Arthrobacter]|uniref:Alpha/beta hydrolase n=1 Tax=Arthrobacter terricola TaxID=2547396 RepID=A0A4R5KQ73_9MICC|nr:MULTISPECIES: alpha/beta hydrolase [Arthrobacter]MBT8160720.1 alpha/beta hydrolase [Arthrobacter sp. GN70]TDF97871.1 alpha/beta hydrolase [Arthrobacter terricola]